MTAVSAGEGYACALIADGTVQCWGVNGAGQLGNNSTADSLFPVPVSGVAGVTSLSAGNSFACAVTAGGIVWCWGTGYGPAPVQILGGVGSTQVATAVAVGYGAACAIVNNTAASGANGAVFCWGVDEDTGGVTVVNSPTPVAMSGLASGVSSNTMGTAICVLTTTGIASCLGDDTFGELGDGIALIDGESIGGNSSTPVPVVGFP